MKKVFKIHWGARKKISTDAKRHTKEHVLNLVKQSKRKDTKLMLPEIGGSKRVGPIYNLALGEFVAEKWDPEEASKNSPSLKYLISKIKQIKNACN